MNMEMLIVLTLIVIAGLLAVIYYLIKTRKNNDLDGYSSKIDELKSTIDDFKNQNANQQASLRESVHDMYTLLTKGSSKKNRPIWRNYITKNNRKRWFKRRYRL